MRFKWELIDGEYECEPCKGVFLSVGQDRVDHTWHWSVSVDDIEVCVYGVHNYASAQTSKRGAIRCLNRISAWSMPGFEKSQGRRK